MSRVLVISPHPDDDVIGCGGALRAHVVAGDTVHVIFLTSGEKGGHGLAEDETVRVREEEAKEAGRILGFDEPEFLREFDGALCVTDPLVSRLRTKIAELQPDWLYVPHEAEMHADHQAANRLVYQAISNDAKLCKRPCIRLYEVWTPMERIDDVVDISPYIELKLRAVRAHKSQCAVLRFDEAIQGLNRYRGEMHSWPGGDYAEIFLRTQW
jgi:LmbE family N-acetylglucosaminyl deacetylase